MRRVPLFMQAACLAVCFLFYGCGGEPFQYDPPNELKPGPGLFSGEDGEFNLIGGDREETEQEDEPERRK